MKLTKLQRHTAYIILLAELEKMDADNMFSSFCYLISEALDRFADLRKADDLKIKHFRELIRKEPDHPTTNFWFPRNSYGKRKRIEILKQCIEETY